MREKFRHTVAILALVFYLPAVLALGWLHTDEFPRIGSGHATIQSPGSNLLVLPKGSDETCNACLFAAGHLLQATPSPVVNSVVFVAPVFHPFKVASASHYTASPRAPPSSLA